MRSSRVWCGRTVSVGVIAFLSLVATGCGDSDASGSDSPEDESGSEPSGESIDLGDFPIAAPPGGDVSSVQSDTSRLITYPASQRESIIEFYEQWIAEGDWVSLEGIDPEMVTIGDQFSFSVAASETEVYQMIGTPSGDKIDVGLVILQ